MNKIRRGDVVIMDLPFDSGSHIQGGKRPWVVLQNDTGNASSPCTMMPVRWSLPPVPVFFRCTLPTAMARSTVIRPEIPKMQRSE